MGRRKTEAKRMDSKAQGALEYLLLIGGAVLIAALVISILTSSATSGKNVATNAVNKYNNAASNLENLGP